MTEVDDPSKRRTLKRFGVAAGGTAVAGGTGLRLAPRYSPIGRAEAALPAVVAAAGILLASRSLAGHYGDYRGTEEYDRLQRLGLWSQAIRTCLDTQATERQMTNFLLDFTEFSKGRFFAEAAVRALEAVEDDASESEA
ncbi:hypothetical protein ACFODZ_17125, partial [Marinicella sediminis]